MITHVVLLQPKASSSDEEITKVLRQVEALRQVIPGLTGIAVGKNRSTYHRGYTHGIIMHFIDEAHLQAHHLLPRLKHWIASVNRRSILIFLKPTRNFQHKACIESIIAYRRIINI